MSALSYKATAILAGSLLLATGCSKSFETKNRTDQSIDRGVVDPTQNPRRPVQVERTAGSFVFELNSLNSDAKGNGSIFVQGDHFEISVNMKGVEAFSSHAQYLHAGSECPDLSFDSNADEYLDSAEALMASGKILIPLDGDISAQMLDSNVFPSANGQGNYSYQNSTSLVLMLGDLQSEDENEDDSYIKLRGDEGLSLEGRTVLIYGVPTATQVPLSVRSFNGLNRWASVPVACGKVFRVQEEIF